MSENKTEDDIGINGGQELNAQTREISKSGFSRLLIAAGIAVVLLAVGYYYYDSLKYESTDDAFIDGRIVSVSPRVAGHVARVYVQDNQQVEEGLLLVELYNEDFRRR